MLRTKERDEDGAGIVDILLLRVEALGERLDDILQSRLEILAQCSLLVNCGQ